MTTQVDGKAIVWCDGAFLTPNGKTAHGLVRFTRRYEVLCVVDRRHAGRDAGEALDGVVKGIPVVADLETALASGEATHLVVGLAPDGGRLPPEGRAVVERALRAGLNVDCGLHDFLTDDPELVRLAAEHQVLIRDVRKTPGRDALHSFSGRIEEVRALKVAVLGTDSAVGKRTTAWLLVEALGAAGFRTEMIGTGQTAWLQGVRYGILLDSLINDFLAGELEHAVVSAWDEQRPHAIVVEGQGSLMNPAYPGGYEILAACRPDAVLLQHAPTRLEYDGFPGYPLHDVRTQIQAIELVSGKPVVAVTVNHEGLGGRAAIDAACAELEEATGLPAVDPLVHGLGRVVEALRPWLP